MAFLGLQLPILIVCSISAFIATFAIVCRIWARVLTQKRWQANDYLMILSFMATLGMLSMAMVSVFSDRYGVHLWDIEPNIRARIHRHPESRAILTTLALTSATLCNLSISHLYTTLFPHNHFLIVCRIHMVFNSCFWITFFVVQFFSCPRPKGSEAAAMAAKCAENIKTIWVTASAVGMLINLSNVILPMPILWTLQVDYWKKFRLTILFGLGFFIVGITAMRIYWYRNLDAKDWTYHTGRIILFNGPEPTLGILAGCLPVISPCFSMVSRVIRSSLGSSRSSDPEEHPGVFPPTIGAAKNRLSIRSITMGIGSKHEPGSGFQRLEYEDHALKSITVHEQVERTEPKSRRVL